MQISIQRAETGISGFIFDLSVENGNVAEIGQVIIPPFGLFLISDLPAASVNVRALDLAGLLEGNIDNEILATVNVDLLQVGETTLSISVKSIDDDQGSSLVSFLTIVSGTISVTTGN